MLAPSITTIHGASFNALEGMCMGNMKKSGKYESLQESTVDAMVNNNPIIVVPHPWSLLMVCDAAHSESLMAGDPCDNWGDRSC